MKQFFLGVCGLLVFTALTAAQTGETTKQTQPQSFDGLKALTHSDADVRLRAAQLLCDLGPVAKFAIPALHEQLKDEKSAVVRVKIAEALWKVEKPPARTLLPALLQALTDKDESARANAANVIGQLGGSAKSAVPALAKALEDKDLTVRVEAALALGAIGPEAKAAVPALLAVLKSAEVLFLEPFVLGTLGKIGAEAVPDLKDALTAKEYRLRRGAAYALGLIGPPAASAVLPLGKMLEAPEPDLRAVAARALGKIGKNAKTALPGLQNLLTDKEPSPRIQAAVSIWHVDGSGTGLPVVVTLLKDNDTRVREEACAALAELSGSKLVPPAALEDALRDSAPSVRALAADALGKLGSAAIKSLPVLRELYKDASGNVRVSAAVAVWRIEPKAPDVIPALTAWLSDNQQTRKAAAAALGEIGPDARPAWDTLLELYRDDPVFGVQRAAGIALRQIDLKAAIKAGVR